MYLPEIMEIRNKIKDVNKNKYYMTGYEFKFIRREWGISLKKIAETGGYKSASTILYWEEKKFVTIREAHLLKLIIGEENFKKMRDFFQEFMQAKKEAEIRKRNAGALNKKHNQ